MIQPTRRAIGAAFGGLALALLPALSASLWPLWALYLIIFALVFGLDLVLMLAPRQLELKVEAPGAIMLGEAAEIVVTGVAARYRGRVWVEVLCPIEGDAPWPSPARLLLDGGSDDQQVMALEPARRGELGIERVYLRWSGPLGLVSRTTWRATPARVAVIPNIAAVRRAALRLATHHTFMAGVKQRRFVGDGSEFEALREFMPGMDRRGIDWRASARHNKLVSREMRSERNHRVVLAVDTGRLMLPPLGGIPRLDHAINAALLLGYLSLKMGDQVGMAAFDESLRHWSEPAPGVQTVQRLMELSTRLNYSTAETNFTRSLSEIAARLKRRAVIVIFTDFTDTISAQLMLDHVGHLARRHLVLFVAIRDPDVDALVRQAPTTALAVNEAVIAAEIQRDRDVVLNKLRRMGVFCVDALPEQATVEMINHYLDIHRRELV
jgi:uncharacterized protein (DUF58 family)